jgi:tripartite-type tricarboxylate transporter receptor subunit TctC
LAAIILVVPMTTASADAVSDFYAGKTITLVIGAGDGGFYDLGGRIIARHLQKYLPGNPNIIPRNMPGASQLRATEFTFNRAPRDGTSLMVVQPYVVLNKLLDRSLAFEVQEFTWLGRVNPLEVVGVAWHTVRATTLRDARQQEIIFGGNASTGPASMIPWALNRLTGTKFKVARGYQSEMAEFLAMERGEIDGIGNATLSELVSRFGDRVRFLYASSIDRLRRIPDVPTIVEVVEDERDRSVMHVLGAAAAVGLTLAGPPEIQKDRVAALRSAFDRMIEDREFTDDLKMLGYEPDAMRGGDLARFINDNFNRSGELVDRLKAATAPE